MRDSSLARRLRRRCVSVSLVGLAVLTMAACGGASGSAGSTPASGKVQPASVSQLVQAAKKEGGLTIYGVPSDQELHAYIKAFDKQYGLHIGTPVRLVSSALEQRFLTEERAHHNQADVVIAVTPQLFRGNAKLFQPISAALIPDLGKYPQSAVFKRSVQVTLDPTVILYNTHLVHGSAIPTTWKDLLQPRFKGNLLVTDPRTGPEYIDWVDSMAKAYGLKFLRQLTAQRFKLAASAAPAAQQVAAGASEVAVPSFPLFASSLPKGAPVAYKIPLPAYVTEVVAGIPANAPHPAAARLFVDWLLSSGGIRVTCSYGVGNPAYPHGGLGCLNLGSHYTVLTYPVPKQRRAQLLKALGLHG